jgi:peptidoglycan/xylan/chitin deacetylase (PgdA/CDA1 family)
MQVDESEELGSTTQDLTRSLNPPGGLTAAQVPQFVAVTFDDNFGGAGMDWANFLFAARTNPAGSGNAATFDGTPVRTTFFHNSFYLSEQQSRWQTAVSAGHEVGDHTHGHLDGIGFDVGQWQTEIGNCRTSLSNGLGIPLASITGFRAPFLHYNDDTFTVLRTSSPAFTYDTSIMGCWATGEGPTSCPWPYTMENGSADADAVFTKFSGRNVRSVAQHAGLWEVPVSVLFVPPDSMAAQYGFPTGLRSRIEGRLGNANNPNFFEASTGKLVAMDITLFLDARMTRAEVLASLKYTLDQRLAGNRAPFVFVAHAHVYQGWGVPGDVASEADRKGVIQDFIDYALSKPEVRMRPLSDVVTWMSNPVALGGSSADRTEGGTVSTSTANACASSEGPDKVYDNQSGTKWCALVVPSTSAPLSTAYDFAGSDAYVVTSYKITTANDQASRDPRSWTLQGCATSSCAAGSDAGWVTLDTRSNELAGAGRFQTNTYSVSNTTAYQKYRLRITANNGSTNITQFSELQLFGAPGGSCTPTTCAAQGKNCGGISDGCGGTLSCGSCTSPQTCGGGGTANVCGGGSGSCNPSVGSFTQAKCNSTAVYNGNLYRCISQAAGVNSEPGGCGTPGVYCSTIEPTNAAWGSTAWQHVQACP